MPHVSLKLIPGVNQNKTPALNEAAISYSQLIRFIPDAQGIGLPQKLGGWLKFFPNAIGSIVRSLWAWTDINDISHLALGAEASLDVITNGSINVITPLTFTDNVPVKVETVQGSSVVIITDGGAFTETTTAASGTGLFATLTFTGPHTFAVGTSITVSGVVPSGYNGTYVVSSSTTTSVTFSSTVTGVQTTPGTITNSSNVSSSDSVDIVTPIAVGGLVLFGLYQCTAINSLTYSIVARNTLGNPENATFTTSTITVTGASGDGTTAVLTFSAIAAANVPAVGSYVTVTGVVPDGYNGSFIVTASTTTSLSYKITFSTGYTSGGLIKDYGTVPLFSTVSGVSTVTVILPSHGYGVDDTFSLLVSLTLNGITLYGNYAVQSVLNSYSFTIQASTIANATSTDPTPLNSGNARYKYYVGLSQPLAGVGFGLGAFGAGYFGFGVVPASTTGTPITASDWSLDNWGSILIASPVNTNGTGGPIYTWNPTSNQQNATIIPQAPISNDGIFVAMPQRQIIAWGSTFNGIQDPLLIRWCDVENYNVWIAQVQNQAGSFRIPKGSKIVGCLQSAQQGLVWTDLAVWAMQYIGQPYVYSFNEIGTGCGLISRKAACSMNGTVFWMSQSQFYQLSGNGISVIYCPVWDVIFQDLDTTHLQKIRVAPNSRFGEVTWYYPTISNGGEINAYVKYNANLQQWDYGTLGRTAWINQSVLGAPIGAGQDPSSGSEYIYQHEFLQSTQTACFNADTQPMNSYFQTGFFVLTEATEKMFVDQIWPDMRWGFFDGQYNGGASYQTPTATVLMTFYVCDYPGQTPITYGPFTMTQATTFLTPRFRGRLVSIKIESNDINTFWRLGNIRYRLQPDGRF